MGKLTISMAIFNSYVKLPEGKWPMSTCQPQIQSTQHGQVSWMAPRKLEFLHVPSGYLTVRHGIDDPFIDGLPIKNGDFPWLC